MKKIFSPAVLKNAFNHVKPWLIVFVVFIIFRYTGLISSISFLANTALLKTGIMDADTEISSTQKNFNYNFSLLDLQSNKIDMKQFKGKTIFLNLWATWCGPCRVEMPSIQKLYEKTNPEKVVFVMLSIDHNDALRRVQNYVKDKQHTFPVYLPAGSLPPQLQVPSIPTTFIINPEGKIVRKEVGAANYDTEDFKKFLEGL